MTKNHFYSHKKPLIQQAGYSRISWEDLAKSSMVVHTLDGNLESAPNPSSINLDYSQSSSAFTRDSSRTPRFHADYYSFAIFLCFFWAWFLRLFRYRVLGFLRSLNGFCSSSYDVGFVRCFSWGAGISGCLSGFDW